MGTQISHDFPSPSIVPYWQKLQSQLAKKKRDLQSSGITRQSIEMGLELRQELAHIKKWGLFHKSKNLFQDQQINEYSSLCEYIKGG